jgi:hypothetical protein
VRKVANVFLTIGVAVALQAMVSVASLATDGGELEKPSRQAGEDRWVPSLAITSGVTVQQQEGSVNSVLFEDGSDSPVLLQGFFDGDDVAVSPFVGGALELMAPALPIPTRPRLFVSGEILPTFASDRDLALEGDPGCIRGPKPGAPCARDGGDPFDESGLNGEGSKTSAQVDTLVYGASLGVAFPVRVGKRQLRIKPSVGWIHYKIEAEALVVDAACNPVDRCTDVSGTELNPKPPPFFIPTVDTGFLRERTLTASGSQRFNGIGPGLDVELDTGRFGPLGVSLFMGGRAYAIVDDRTISFSATASYNDQLGTDDATALFEAKVDPWMFRAHVGIRFHYLGNQD